jgi:hypothetical protein
MPVDAITVKVPALLVMAQALANGGMDYVTLSTQSDPVGCTGYLRFEAYHKNDPVLAMLVPLASFDLPQGGFDMIAAQGTVRALQ